MRALRRRRASTCWSPRPSIEVGVDVAERHASWWSWTPTGSASPSCTSCAAGSAVAAIPGLCLLVTGAEAERRRATRLDAVAATTDGFELARVDLEQRREGDVLGARAARPALAAASSCGCSTTRTSSSRPARTPTRSWPPTPTWPATPTSPQRVAVRVDAEQAAYLEQG